MTQTIQIQKKKITKLTIILIILSFLCIVLIPETFAAPDTAETDLPHSMCNTVFNGVINSVKEILNGGGAYGDFYNLMIGDGLNTDFAPLVKTVTIIGAFWCIAIAMSHLFTNLDRGQDTVEAVFKSLMEIAIAGMFLIMLSDIMKWVAQLGTEIITMASSGDVAEKANDVDAMLVKLTGKSEGNNWWKLQAMAALFLPWALSLLLQVAAKFVAFSILIEIGIRRLFAPMAAGDIYQEGIRSPGARYLKKYLATFIKMALILVICGLGAKMMQAIPDINGEGPGSVMTFLFDIIAINFTCLGVMFKAGEFANDAVGV